MHSNTAHPDEGGSAGFPKFNAQVPIPPPAKADPPVLPAAALGSEQSYNEQKGKGKEFEKGVVRRVKRRIRAKVVKATRARAKNSRKVQRVRKEKKERERNHSFPRPQAILQSVHAFRKEPPDLAEPNSNKMSDGAMTDGLQTSS